jgi:type IV secretion system protein VirB11
MWPDFMKLMISSKKSVLLSGATGSGKTGFINMLLGLIGNQERLITIEDSREVLTRSPDKKRNMINLLSRDKGKNTIPITNSDLLKACLRLRPDRVLLSEIRGEDAFVFFNSLHTGHSGSLSTIHANSAEDIWIRLVNMMSMAAETGGLTKSDILEYCKSSLDVVMHCEKSDGKWRMLDVITHF